MTTLDVKKCEFIIYDMNKKRSQMSTGIVRLLALVVTGLVENVFISSHEHNLLHPPFGRVRTTPNAYFVQLS